MGNSNVCIRARARGSTAEKKREKREKENIPSYVHMYISRGVEFQSRKDRDIAGHDVA